MSSPAFAPAALDVTRPFTRAEALAAGLTDQHLGDATTFVRIFRGVYVGRATTRTLAVRTRAALRIAPPSAMASHETAAVLWGGTVPPQSDIHLTVPQGLNCQAAGIRTHRYLQVAEPVIHRGVRLTPPERTVCDLAPRLDLVGLVVLGDRLVRRGATTPIQLIRAADEWPGDFRSRLQRATRLVRVGVDSPPESRLRMLVVLAGLPEPTVNHIIRHDETGDWLRRFELAYLDLLLAIEYQGRWHRESDDVWEADIARREELDHHTWRVVEVLGKSLSEDPGHVLQRIEAARRDRGARATKTWSEEWRPYFPGTPDPRRQLRT
ncbi:MAG: hypothetical protein ABJA89_07805 [Lapillicoccus sp.]